MLRNIRQKYSPGSNIHSVNHLTNIKFQKIEVERILFLSQKFWLILSGLASQFGKIRLSLFMVKTLEEASSIDTELW